MGYQTAEKNNILNMSGKWMELENIILSEVTQKEKVNYHMFSLAKKICPVISIPENLNNNEDPKRDIHISNLHGT